MPTTTTKRVAIFLLSRVSRAKTKRSEPKGTAGSHLNSVLDQHGCPSPFQGTSLEAGRLSSHCRAVLRAVFRNRHTQDMLFQPLTAGGAMQPAQSSVGRTVSQLFSIHPEESYVIRRLDAVFSLMLLQVADSHEDSAQQRRPDMVQSHRHCLSYLLVEEWLALVVIL